MLVVLQLLHLLTAGVLTQPSRAVDIFSVCGLPYIEIPFLSFFETILLILA